MNKTIEFFSKSEQHEMKMAQKSSNYQIVCNNTK